MDDTPKAVDRVDSSSDELGDVVQLDNQLLEEIGYKQEFKREFTRLSTLSYAISIMGVMGSVPATYGVPLGSSGPAAAIWCWFIGTFMSLTIALSVAELCSSYPTAGGMYVVTKYVVADRSNMPLAAWIIGWSNFLGQTAGVASVAYSVGQFILAMVSLGSGFDDVAQSFRYSPTPEHTVAASIGMLVLMGMICSLPSKWLSDFIVWFAPINILAAVSISIAMLVLTENKNSASYTFTHFTDGSGWGNKGFSFLIGFLGVVWTMTDYDATAHLAEETRNAAVRGPVAIGEAIIVSGVFGLLLCIAFGFCVGDGSAALESTSGHPIAQIMYNAGGQAGGLGMFFWVFLIQFFTGTSAMLSDTRQAFAFARDHALPFSHTLKKINKYTQTPLYSVWLVVVFCCCLNLIALGSVQTINSIFAVTAPALDLSYIAVVILRLMNEDKIHIRKGPFNLGRYSKPINYIACAWTFFVTVILFFPPIRPVTALNMNYAIAVATFIILFATSWWYLRARNVYIGPRTDDNLLPEEPQDASKSQFLPAAITPLVRPS